MSDAASDGYWQSADGLRLHYRVYGQLTAKAPVLCLPGLTRNWRDYDGLAGHLSASRRVYCLDFRGRGGSEYAKDSTTYMPAIYAGDVELLLAEQGIEKFVAIGTSLGGIVSLILGGAKPERLAGLILNDVGPVIDAAGLDRIRPMPAKANPGRPGCMPRVGSPRSTRRPIRTTSSKSGSRWPSASGG